MLPASDNHSHANPIYGLGAREIARRFKRQGGVLLVLVSPTTWSLGLRLGSEEDLIKLYEATVNSARAAREEGLASLAIVGLHPAEVARSLEIGWSEERVLKFGRYSVELAEKFVKKGLAAGFGEYGRPHWDADARVIRLCEKMMMEVFESSRDTGGVVHLHTERKGATTVESIYSLIDEVGGDPSKIVLHHAQPESVRSAAARNIIASVPIGRKGEMEEVLRLDPVYVVESDFMDDPKRPGAVIPPWTLAKKMRKALMEGLIDEDSYWKVMVENPSRLYGIDLA